MPDITPSEITTAEWRSAGGSWNTIPNPHRFRYRCLRYSDPTDVGYQPGRPRIRGELLTLGTDEHLDMMDFTNGVGTLAELRVTYKTEEGNSRRVTITNVMFVGEGLVTIGNRSGTDRRQDSETCKTPFEVFIPEDDAEFSDFVTDVSV